MKLYQNEQLYQFATEGFRGENHELEHRCNKVEKSLSETTGSVLRQLFVTVSPKLCAAVKQHIYHLKSFISSSAADSISMEVDNMFDEEDQFQDIPDSFIDIPSESFPLVITFYKFLMMLDGTLGNSYFGRFFGVTNRSNLEVGTSSSVVLQAFLREKEVKYESFSSSYWPHFNSNLTKSLDPSRVFTEIISSIKGGLRAIEATDGRLSREEYVGLSEARTSSLSCNERGMVYDIFISYEKMKMEKGEFDIADFVINLHFRLKDEGFQGVKMNFVYIDEVQDLTMSQIALFRHICNNVEEGFVFSGDTAQTIARGIDFRFEEIRHLFYENFIMKSRSIGHVERTEKGKISDLFQLTQNFRTHNGILKLSHSIIELLYYFFPLSIDELKPETSMIYGEAPILIECGTDENAMIRIFGNGKANRDIVGFGAEQVILVRDNNARREISQYAEKQALVLTILECKGLEFQDVLLYNFFGSSPLRNHWRVIYNYLKDQNMLDSTSQRFPKFSVLKHNILCSELKQLYVAVTRTRQRLWICENEGSSEPMFEYWKHRCLVQVRRLDDSVAKAMQVASSPQEWKSRGIKLYQEHNYEMATFCFERAGDTHWERRSKAAGLKAMADGMRTSKPKEANSILREAAEIYEAIGMAVLAARCFSDLGEYERAGRIYLEKCGESKFKKAGECFYLAGCYKLAADVYARGNFFAECLNVCSKEKLFENGLEYIQYWKQQAKSKSGMDKIEQEFLESCALHYHKIKDKKSMMKFVKAFHSMDLIRDFLRSLGCLDELLLVENESENFLEAANIAKMIGDILVEVDMLGKAENFKKAASLIILYVRASSLWSQNSKGWPLKKFEGMEELLTKAKSFAKNVTDEFSDLVCVEADLYSNEHFNLPKIKSLMKASQRHESVAGEILSAWKILEAHLSSKTSKYLWEDELLVDLTKYSEDLISKDQVSVESLGYFWNLWKDSIVKIFEYLGCLGNEGINKYQSYGDFCLEFLGVRTHVRSHDTLYILLEPHSYWAKDVEKSPFGSTGKLVSIFFQQLVSSSRSYWDSELVSVGLAVLEKLKVLYDFIKNNSIFYKTRTLIHIHEVGKFLSESQFLKKSYGDASRLQNFIRLSTKQFVDLIFHLDWHNSLSEKMVILRSSPVSKNILKEFVIENIYSTGQLSYGQIGRIAMTIFGSSSLDVEDYIELLKRLEWNPLWKQFFETIFRDMERHRSSEASKHRQNTGEQVDLTLVFRLFAALEDVYNANWRKIDDYISPSCFFYLIEYLLIWVSCHNHSFITTKSFFLQWIAYDDENEELLKNASGGQSYQNVVHFVMTVVHQCLFNKKDMIDWIKKSTSNANEYYSQLVPRVVAITCMVWVNFGVGKEMIFGLLGVNYITENLPFEFCDVISRRAGKSKLLTLDVIAKAFKAIDNPLVIVNLGGKSSGKICESTIYLDLKTKPCKNEMLRKLFPRTPVVSHSHHEATATELDKLQTKKPSISYDYDMLKCSTFPDSRLNQGESSSQNIGADLPKDCSYFWEIFEGINIVVDRSDQRSFLSIVQEAKVAVEKCILFLTDAVTQNSCSMTKSEEKIKFEDVDDMITELKQLSTTLDLSETELRNKVIVMEELWNRLQCKRPKVEPILTRLFQQKMDLVGDTSLEQVAECMEEKSNLADERNSSSDGDSQPLANSGPQDSSKCDEGKRSKKSKKNKNKNNKKSRSKKKNK